MIITFSGKGYWVKATAVSSFCTNMTWACNHTQSDPKAKESVNEPVIYAKQIARDYLAV